MAQIKLDTASVATLSAAVRRQEAAMSQIAGIFSSVSSNLDMEIKLSSSIQQDLSDLKRRGTQHSELLHSLAGGLEQVVNDFMSKDKKLANDAKGVLALLNFIGMLSPYLGNTVESDNLAEFFKMDPATMAVTGLFGAAAMTSSALTATDAPAVLNTLINRKEILGDDFSYGTLSGYAGLLGYETTDNSFEAYLGKVEVKDEVEIIGDVKSTTDVKLKVGTIHGGHSTAVDFWGDDTSSNAKEGFDYNGHKEMGGGEGFTIYDGEMVSKDSWTLFDAHTGGEVGLTVAELTYDTVIGTDDINGTVGASTSFLDADLSGKLGMKVDDDGFSGVAKAEVGATLWEVEGHAGVNVMGVEAEASVSAELGLGASAGVSYNDGKLDVELGLAIGVGGKVKFSIGLPDIDWPW